MDSFKKAKQKERKKEKEKEIARRVQFGNAISFLELTSVSV